MRHLLKAMVEGVGLERPARAVVGWLRRLAGEPAIAGEWRERMRRDERRARELLGRVLKRDSSCVDVGAHAGEWVRWFVDLAPEGGHWAFEPLPAYAERLRRAFPEVEVVESALSDHGGRETFYCPRKYAAWSGLGKQVYPGETEVEEIEVELARLDDALPGDVKVDFMKIDVEGAELQVLGGAAQTIGRYRPWIVLEHAKVHAEGFGTTPAMLYDLLVGRWGYALTLLSGTEAMERDAFVATCERAAEGGYGVTAETNFVARPGSTC